MISVAGLFEHQSQLALPQNNVHRKAGTPADPYAVIWSADSMLVAAVDAR